MKKMLAIVMTFAVLFGVFSVAFAAENGAVDSIESVQETPEGYTAIRTAEDLNNIRNDLAGKYILMNDVDLSVYENWVPIGDAENPFTGALDGNGYMIKNLTIITECNSENNYIGLFGYAAADIKNLIVLDANIKAVYVGEELAKGYVGIVAGTGNPHLSNIAVTGSVHEDGFSYSYVGGICGLVNYNGCVENCSNYADINASVPSVAKEVYAGGVCGGVDTLGIKLCCNIGNVYVFGENVSKNCEAYVGGIYGKTHCEGFGDTLTDCYNRGIISIDFSTEETCIGGLAGEGYDTKNIYSVGKIAYPSSSNLYVGTLVGNIFESFLGEGLPAKMINARYIHKTPSPAYYGKQIPDSFDDKTFQNTKLLTEEEFKKQESFEGFDFEKVWAMEENGYPVLQNQPIINVKEDVELEIGDTFELPDYESVKSADESIAKANENELVALSAGTTTVTLTHAYGYYTEYTITVAEEEITTEPTTEVTTTEPVTETTTEKVEISTTIPEPSTTEKEETTQSTTAPVTEPETQPSTVPESTTEP
ncbi:MAG: hypothetical protein J6A60_08860, partial [Clostridia bacterium]|nr:hypothetical protein [Clostridia bacterium]